jgi:hypothetical protein
MPNTTYITVTSWGNAMVRSNGGAGTAATKPHALGPYFVHRRKTCSRIGIARQARRPGGCVGLVGHCSIPSCPVSIRRRLTSRRWTLGTALLSTFVRMIGESFEGGAHFGVGSNPTLSAKTGKNISNINRLLKVTYKPTYKAVSSASARVGWRSGHCRGHGPHRLGPSAGRSVASRVGGFVAQIK